MKLENQVCTRQQSEQLKALGIEQTSVACYIGDELHLFEKHLYNWAEQKNISAVAAYTVAELGVMLPCGEELPSRDDDSAHAEWDYKGWYAVQFCSTTEADARASLLIHLLENNHTTAEEVNQRLQP